MKKLIMLSWITICAFSITCYANEVERTCFVKPIKPTRPGYKDSIDIFRNDSDWLTIAHLQYNVINSFVSSKIDLGSFDFTDQSAFLTVIGMDSAEYAAESLASKEAAERLIERYSITGSCTTCSLSLGSLLDTLRSSLTVFRNNSDLYSTFKNESLNIGDRVATTYSCCGFWFYLCCTVCAATIEAFPVYLACCALCFHSECCNPS